MNANRTKYASTPTYGMQKRGLFKKAPVRQAPEAPDFSQVPTPSPVAPSGQPAAQPVFSQQPLTPQGAYFPSNPYFPQGGAVPPMQPVAQVPFAAPSFIQPAAGAQPPFQGFRQDAAPSQQLPLGNSAPSINPAAAFSARSQGYVPPAAQQPASTRPAVQPASFANAAPPYGSMAQGGMPQRVMNYGASMPQQPFAPVQQTPPMQPPQQPMYTAATAPKQPRQRAAMDADKLWALFLFGLLPLLFIPCLFVPSTLDALRYAFIGLCVVGLGGMWYRQMFTSVTRLIVSIAYVALCIVAIAMMMQGGNDVRYTGAASPQNVQASPAPDSQPAAAAATEYVPVPTPSPTVSGPSEAEQRLTTFMTLWQVNNTPEMVSLVQPSWASQQENASSALFMVLANRTPEEFTIEEISGSDQDTSRTVTMTATINKNNGKDPSVYRFMILMVKEGGEWYVDPKTLATNDSVQSSSSSDENAVNAQAAVSVSATPRTTVTPAPPGDTVLYYNENGGSFYHLDPYCPKVDSKYLPLTGTFAYRDLKQVMNEKGLNPCLKCNAPTSALPDE